MKNLIHLLLTNDYEILGIILSMLYFIVPILIIGGVVALTIKIVDEIGTRREMKEFRRHPDLYEFAKRRYNR